MDIQPAATSTESSHDEYGKHVLDRAAGVYCDCSRGACRVDYGGLPHTGGFIDGTVGGTIAVEVESRVAKQIRGAVLDLICHPYPKKLLIILPVHAQNPALTAAQCTSALRRFVDAANFRVVVLRGSGTNWQLDDDATLVRAALVDLGFDEISR